MVLDTNRLTFARLIKPITKLMLLTYKDGKEDLKIRVIKMVNFVMTVKGKMMERFKL
jgi:hypothetical protein